MVKNEYQRFLKTLCVDEKSIGVRKIANLVLGNFEKLLPIGTSQGKRARMIAEQASKAWSDLPDTIEDFINEIGNGDDAIKQLKSIKIGPFRGFAKEENLDLYSMLVLIYGPNGTGKSSFCEAIEYGLLGSVEDAQNKRFPNHQDYLKNAHVNQFVKPVIEGINSKDETVVVSHNEAQYRFCFVEKNRIDNFSRIAAHTPAKQTELISSLFGLENFNEFVKNFSRKMDERHIDLVGEKGLLLKTKQQSIEIHKQTIENNKQALVTQSEKETKLASQFKPDTTFVQLVDTLGTDKKPGEIQALETQLQQNRPPLTGLTVIALEENKAKVELTHKKLTDKLVELAVSSEGLSYKQLYGAVLDLKKNSEDKCPACKTPLTQVTQNPYELAKTELTKLGHLAQLEQERDQLQIDFLNAIKSVHTMLKFCIEQIGIEKEVNSLRICLVEDETKLGWKWWQTLEPGSKEMASHWWLLKDQVKKLEQRDDKVKKANKEREPKQTRLAELRQIEKQIIKLKAKRNILESDTQKAKLAVESFYKDNKELIEAVKVEKTIIKTNQKIATDYLNFVDKLVEYKEQLPNKLVADLGDIVVKLYNAFNRNDASKDLLAGIKLPLATGHRIEIAYQSEPNKYFDALHILSEGHIRCIGLAILLAKNIKESSSLLIFDDPINAIDDEHRSAIRETLFKDDYFTEKQIILACHGEEFFKNIHQSIGKKAAKESESYIFRPQIDENHVQVISLKRPKNYLLAAIELHKQAEYRDSLMSSRRALEYLCKKAWIHYAKNCDKSDSLISVSKRHPNAPWDLRNLAENLKTKMNKSRAEIPNKDEIVGALETLLGVNGQDLHWLYLNKGTHEESDREEFDHAAIGIIISSLSQLDDALL